MPLVTGVGGVRVGADPDTYLDFVRRLTALSCCCPGSSPSHRGSRAGPGRPASALDVPQPLRVRADVRVQADRRVAREALDRVRQRRVTEPIAA